MNNEEMQKVLEDYVDTHPGTSFAEIERLFKENGFDFSGDETIFVSDDYRVRNIVSWSGWNTNAVEILNNMLKKNYHFSSCEPIIYIIDHQFLPLPLAKKRDFHYKKPHWLPLVMNVD